MLRGTWELKSTLVQGTKLGVKKKIFLRENSNEITTGDFVIIIIYYIYILYTTYILYILLYIIILLLYIWVVTKVFIPPAGC